MKISDTEASIEAILFAYGDAVELCDIAKAINVDEKTTYAILKNLKDKYIDENRGIYIIEADNKFQMCTNPLYYDTINVIFNRPKRKVMSQSILETLAIIAYKQPITKPQIEQIRGVNADHAVNKLIEYNMVEERGRLDVPGKPILFGTTEEFLKYFGFTNIDSLPDISENNVDENQISFDDILE